MDFLADTRTHEHTRAHTHTHTVPHTLSLSLWGNKTQPQTSKASESTASLSLAERWTITEIRRQSNSVLTYSLLTDVVPL